MNKKKSFIVQGSILAMAGIISRIMGVFYRIPMTYIIGDEGMGVYATAYSVYSILLLISYGSLPLAVSKLVSAKLGMKEYKNARKVFLGAMAFGMTISLIMALLLFFGADFFANSIMGMPESSYAMRALAPAILFLGALGVLRGYFQGYGSMIPTAVSQLLEQVLNVVISLLAGYLLFKKGAAMDAAGSDYYSTAYGAMGTTWGTVAGAFSALLFFIFLYLCFRKIENHNCLTDTCTEEDAYPDILRSVVLTLIPIVISTIVFQSTSLIDQAVFSRYIGDDYRSLWGVYTNKYTLLYNVPVAVAYALMAATIPEISSSVTCGRKDIAVRKIGISIRFTMLISIPSAVGLGVLGRPCMDLIFRSGNNDMAAMMMYMGSLAVVFFSLSTICNGILQGIGHFWIPIKNALIAFAIHMVVLAVLLWGFKLGIYGVVISNMLFPIPICVLDVMQMQKSIGYKQEIRKTYLLPFAASLIMGAAAFLVYKGVYAVIASNTAAVILAIVIAAVIYFAALIKLDAVNEDEMRNMPKGTMLIACARKLHLL